MPVDIIVGTQWGDEGKGRITDLLAASADIVARFGGGDNAGHSVTVGDELYKLHLLPSGIIHPHTTCILGSGMVLNPAKLVEELDKLDQYGVDISCDRIKISLAAHIITPVHLLLDGAEETLRAEGSLGTTRRGIGPTYADKASRTGIRAGEMKDVERFRHRIDEHFRFSESRFKTGPDLTISEREATLDAYAHYAERLRPYLADTGLLLHTALQKGEVALAEGAQGTLLDLDYGTYPYVTSSHPTSAGALLGLGIGPEHVRRVIGVTKSFQTRVGEGPFPTELSGEASQRLRGTGEQPWDEFGTTTGRPRRCGWLDAVLLRYASRINGLTEIALTKLDILSGIPQLYIATAYGHDHGISTEYPADLPPLLKISPQYEELSGWEEDLTVIRDWNDLPKNAQRYVEFIEAQSDVRVSLISVGPERDQIIIRNELG